MEKQLRENALTTKEDMLEFMGMETFTTLEGSWVDDDGNTHNAFEENLAATRATMYDDIAVRHEESFIIAHKIKVM